MFGESIPQKLVEYILDILAILNIIITQHTQIEHTGTEEVRSAIARPEMLTNQLKTCN